MLDIEALKKYAKIVLVQNGLQLKERLYNVLCAVFEHEYGSINCHLMK